MDINISKVNDSFVKQVEEDTRISMQKDDRKFGMFYTGEESIDVNSISEEDSKLPIYWALKSILDFNENTFFNMNCKGTFHANMFYPVLMLKDYKNPKITLPLYGLWIILTFNNREEILTGCSLQIRRTHFIDQEILTGFIHPYVGTSSYKTRSTCLGHSSLANLMINMRDKGFTNTEELEFFLWNCISYLGNEDQSSGPYTTMYNTLRTVIQEDQQEEQDYFSIRVTDYNKSIKKVNIGDIRYLISLLLNTGFTTDFYSRVDYKYTKYNTFTLADTEKNRAIVKDLIISILQQESIYRRYLTNFIEIELINITDSINKIVLSIYPYSNNSQNSFKVKLLNFGISTLYNEIINGIKFRNYRLITKEFNKQEIDIDNTNADKLSAMLSIINSSTLFINEHSSPIINENLINNITKLKRHKLKKMISDEKKV